MPLEIAAMVLLSAVLHSSWNALLKHNDDKAAAWWMLGGTLAVFALIHCLAAGLNPLDNLVDILPFIGLSLCGQVLYGSCIVATYQRGDLSTYYPIVRSTPLVIVVFSALFLGVRYDMVVLAAIAMVLVGAFLIQYRPGRRVLDDPKTLGLALIALCGTGVYALADAHGVRIVAPQVFFFWIELSLIPTFMVMFRVFGHGAVEKRGLAMLAARPVYYLSIGLVCYASYILILTAFHQGGDVAAVAAVRQASIPVSVLIGGLILKESHLALRLFASFLVAGGIVLIILNG